MARISRLRGTQSLRRQSGKKLPRSITLIVCEGETEQAYFEVARVHYGLSTAEVVLADNTDGAAPISVVRCAEKKCAEPGSYDHVFCVFDRDGHESFPRARLLVTQLSSRKSKPLPIKDAISVPCFELWVLLHFERTDSPFTRCDDVISRVKRHMPGYVKADAATAKKLFGHVDTAIANAEWLESRAETTQLNPYTTVHHVLNHFKRVADSSAQETNA